MSRQCLPLQPRAIHQAALRTDQTPPPKVKYIPYPDPPDGSSNKVNAQSYQVTPFGKPKLTQTVQSEYLLGEGHMNDFNERINNYAQQMTEELSKQNVVLAKVVNSLNKKFNKWSSTKHTGKKKFQPK